MPGIETSSDLYQNRNQGLTTYRKNVQGPTLADEMAKRTEDRAKAARVQARQEPATVAPAARPAVTQAKPATTAPAAPAAPQQSAARPGTVAHSAAPSVHATQAAAVSPAKVVHELYAPTSRTTREHDDRFSMVTGGTVDIRA